VTVRHSSLNTFWRQVLDAIADLQADALRRKAAGMADALDREAMRKVKGTDEWRDTTEPGRFQ
jgi:DUF1680 family protein